MNKLLASLIVFSIACNDPHKSAIEIDFKDSKYKCDYHQDLSKTGPLDFLKSLKVKSTSFKNNSSEFCPAEHMKMCPTVDSLWITRNHISSLLTYLDSNDVKAIPTFSMLSSVTVKDHGKSSLAIEAYALINGFRKNCYPPYCSIPLGGTKGDLFELNDSLKMEIINWWRNELK